MLLLESPESPNLKIATWVLRLSAFTLATLPATALPWNAAKWVKLPLAGASAIIAGASAVTTAELRRREQFRAMREMAQIDAYDGILTKQVEEVTSVPLSTVQPSSIAGVLKESGHPISVALAQAKPPVELRFVEAREGLSFQRLIFDCPPASFGAIKRHTDLIKGVCGLEEKEWPAIAIAQGKIQIDLPKRDRTFPRFHPELCTRTENPAILLGIDALSQKRIYHHLSARGTSPNLKVGGTSGSGKSMACNAHVLSLIFACPPSELQLAVIDLKGGNYSWLENSPWLWRPVAEEVGQAERLLTLLEAERDKRQRQLFPELKAKDLDSYNAKAPNQLPIIVVIIDELAMMWEGSAKEDRTKLNLLGRLAALGRSAGIFLYSATQKPDIESAFPKPSIRDNHPNGLAFQVGSDTATKMLLGDTTVDARALTGKGDFYYFSSSGELRRGQTLAVPEDGDELEELVSQAVTLHGLTLAPPQPLNEVKQHLERVLHLPLDIQPLPLDKAPLIKAMRLFGIAKTEIIAKVWGVSAGGGNFDRNRDNSPLNQYEAIIEAIAPRWIEELLSTNASAEQVANIIWSVPLIEVEAQVKQVAIASYHPWPLPTQKLQILATWDDRYSDDWAAKSRACRDALSNRCTLCAKPADSAHHACYSDAVGVIKGREAIGVHIFPLCEDCHHAAHAPAHWHKPTKPEQGRNTNDFYWQLLSKFHQHK